MRGTRMIPIDDFYLGVKRNALRPDELIRAVTCCRRRPARRQFSKVGTRNAMVIAVCAFGIALHPDTRTVRTGIGSAAPTPIRARTAEEFLAAALDEGGHWDSRAARTAVGGTAVRRAGGAAPPTRSTTCAAPPPTAGTRWP